MAKEPTKFTQTAAKNTPTKTHSFSINTGKVLKWVLIGGVLVSIVAFTAYQTYKIGMKLDRAEKAMRFAYDYPELVEPVADQYYSEYESLKDSMIKRQVLTNGELEETKKE